MHGAAAAVVGAVVPLGVAPVEVPDGDADPTGVGDVAMLAAEQPASARAVIAAAADNAAGVRTAATGLPEAVERGSGRLLRRRHPARICVAGRHRRRDCRRRLGRLSCKRSRRGLRFHPFTPTRVADSRTGLGAPQALGPQTTVTVTPPSALINALTSAVQLNVTAVAASASTVVTVWPAGLGKPLASNLNVPAGAALAAAVVSGVGPAGAFDVYNDVGTVNIVADMVGIFEAWPSPPAVAGQAAPPTPTAAALAGRIRPALPRG